MAFNKGPFLIYAGLEAENKKQPSLFEKDQIEWESLTLQPFLTTLANIKKKAQGLFTVLGAATAIIATWESSSSGCFLGIFNVRGATGEAVHLSQNSIIYRSNESSVAFRGIRRCAEQYSVQNWQRPYDKCTSRSCHSGLQ